MPYDWLTFNCILYEVLEWYSCAPLPFLYLSKRQDGAPLSSAFGAGFSGTQLK
jgi:hypothetical protein